VDRRDGDQCALAFEPAAGDWSRTCSCRLLGLPDTLTCDNGRASPMLFMNECLTSLHAATAPMSPSPTAQAPTAVVQAGLCRSGCARRSGTTPPGVLAKTMSSVVGSFGRRRSSEQMTVWT
jgi:hypothetical protein